MQRGPHHHTIVVFNTGHSRQQWPTSQSGRKSCCSLAWPRGHSPAVEAQMVAAAAVAPCDAPQHVCRRCRWAGRVVGKAQANSRCDAPQHECRRYRWAGGFAGKARAKSRCCPPGRAGSNQTCVSPRHRAGPGSARCLKTPPDVTSR